MNGEIDPSRIYSTEGLKRAAGLGRFTIAEARRSGIVKPRVVGKKLFYLGSEVCQWIKEQPQCESMKRSS